YLDVVKSLEAKGIVIVDYEQLSEQQQQEVRLLYQANILPLVTPLAMDPAHPFPHLSNLSLNLLASLNQGDENESVMARVKVPVGSGVSRFLKIGDKNHFVPLEEVMANNLDLLFPDRKIDSCELFRVTRNANTEKEEEHADDLLEMIETELRDRKFAPIVRLQTAAGILPLHRGMLAAELGLDEDKDIGQSDVMIGMKDLMEIASLDIPELRESAHRPIDNVTLQDPRNIFHIIRENKSILLQHPYESFSTSVERFVREASQDPKVAAIKMTLYRTSAGTAILDYLVDAARNGKQVAVVVELKARFDEAANIQWANLLEEVGVHVTYGVVGLKTHAKAILVVRRDFDGLRRYAHVGTGNYHAGTARLYSDLGLLTSDPDIGHDLTELFNYLTTGCKPSRNYRKILTAPKAMKKALLEKIDREIALQSAGTPGHIRLKTNALEDADIVEHLYRASQAGVKVDLIVRDTCRLLPGIKGLSENIRVVGIVGRFLEHTRIYNFMNGGQPEYYIGSADLMRRNLKSRVEIIAPVEDPAQQRELDTMLSAQLDDQRSVWDMRPDGSYVQRRPEARQKAMGCQQVLVTAAEKRHTDANRLRKRRLRGIARRAAP
ncbi:MAG: polyphosphate kinase 1, partial [Rhodospirillales bacterium]|nr:polyphosphate kinase 1 [Rhodospirillales bacterium]